MKKGKYYTLKNIVQRAPKAKYYMIYGERSNGKTFSVKHLGLFGLHEGKDVDINGYLDDGSQFAILRRFDEDFKGKRAVEMFSDIVSNKEEGNILEKRTKGKWNDIQYWMGSWWLVKRNEKGEVETKDSQPFAFKFSLTSMLHDKSISFPNVRNILFDEFLTNGYYLPDEFVTFMNVLSTIIRDRNDVRIFMCGNTVNKYSPYFADMGLKHVKNQKKGTIDVYTYPNPNLIVAVEYSDFPGKKKESDSYFAFDNPKLKMITSGDWEISIYPHLPYRYMPTDIIYNYFIQFDGETLHCEIINLNPNEENQLKCPVQFTYIHRKTTEIKDDGTTLIYQQEHDPRPNHSRRLAKPRSRMEKMIYSFFQKELVFYQDNEVGEVVRNFINWSMTN